MVYKNKQNVKNLGLYSQKRKFSDDDDAGNISEYIIDILIKT